MATIGFASHQTATHKSVAAAVNVCHVIAHKMSATRRPPESTPQQKIKSVKITL